MYAHFSHIAEETNLPVLLYNIPGRSAVNMLPETIIDLSKMKNIRAVKEASGNLEQMAAIISGTDDGFKVYSGDDGLTLTASCNWWKRNRFSCVTCRRKRNAENDCIF